MIALGVDPGTATCGFGLVALDGGRLRFIDAGVVRTPPDQSDAERLRRLHVAISALVAEHRPDRIGVEQLFFGRNVRTAMSVGQARGVVLLVAAERGLAVDEPTPSAVKQAVCGSGNADKGQVARMVARLLGVTLDGVPDDATDALAVAISSTYRASTSRRLTAAR